MVLALLKTSPDTAVGRKLHEDPMIPNFGSPGFGPVLKPGMTLAIEPMVNAGKL
jgi:methionyl aminopeptidase